MLRQVLSRFKRAWLRQQRRLHPVRISELQRTLTELIEVQPEVLFVHSSLSACGHIAGGPATVISVVRNLALTLVLPTHTYCYPEVKGTAGPVFDARSTPSLVGAISDWFWRQPAVVRSIHPTHSVAATGPRAVSLCAEHERTGSPCGSGTPYDKMLEQRSAVLMFGCTLNTYTLFHTTEHFAHCPYLYYPEQVRLQFVNPNGELQQMSMWRQNMEFPRRFADTEVELAAAGLLRVLPLRQGRLLYIPDAQLVHRYLMERLAANPSYLLKTT